MARKLKICFWIIVSFFSLPVHYGANADDTSEYYIKAAYLYNFAKFMTWPDDTFENSDSPFNLCIIGISPFGDAIKTLDNKMIGKRKFTVQYCEDIGQVKKCHILYISTSEKEHIQTILKKSEGTPRLTVSDMEDFVKKGGMVGFMLKGKKIHFEINVDNIKSSKLNVSSRLLKIATIVRNKPQAE